MRGLAGSDQRAAADSGQRAHLRLAVPLAGLRAALMKALVSPASTTPASLPHAGRPSATACAPASAAMALRWPKASRNEVHRGGFLRQRACRLRPDSTQRHGIEHHRRRAGQLAVGGQLLAVARAWRRRPSARRSSPARRRLRRPCAAPRPCAASEPSSTRMPTQRPCSVAFILPMMLQRRRRRHVLRRHGGRRRRRQRVHAQAVGDALGQVCVDVAQVADDALRAHARSPPSTARTPAPRPCAPARARSGCGRTCAPGCSGRRSSRRARGPWRRRPARSAMAAEALRGVSRGGVGLQASWARRPRGPCGTCICMWPSRCWLANGHLGALIGIWWKFGPPRRDSCVSR